MSTRRVLGGIGRLALVTLLGVGLAGCDIAIGMGSGREQASEEWNRTYQIPATGRVEVINVNGTVEVEGSDSPGVEVRAVRIAKAGTASEAKDLLSRLEIQEEQTGGGVRIETKSPRGMLFGGHSTEVRYHIRAPRTAQIAARTTNGRIEAAGVSGDVRLRSTNGTVTGRGLMGGVEAKTTNGAIRMDLASVASAEVTLSTTNGTIDLTLPSTAKADLAAHVTNGAIRVDGLTFDRDSDSTRRRVAGKLNGGGARIEADTTNGRIQISGKRTSSATDVER